MAGSRDISVIIKTWLFPSIVTLLGTLIWRDMQEMRNDIKALLAQSNIDKTRIDNLERQVEFLNQRVLVNSKNTVVYISSDPNKSGNEDQNSYMVNREMVMLNQEKKKKAYAYLKRKANDISI